MMPQRIKILRIIGRLNVGGPAFHAINLTSRLHPDRFQTILAAGTEHPAEGSLRDLAASRGIELLTVPSMVSEANVGRRDLAAIRQLYGVIRRERPHIVHTHLAKAGFVGRVAARLARVPIIVHTFHGHVLHGYFNRTTSGLLRTMERTMAGITDCLVAVSHQVRRELLEYRIAPPAKLTVIPLGLELDRFRDGQEHRGMFRTELGIAGDAPLIGIVGRIVPIKNHRLFLDAAARVGGGAPGARFVVVGDGVLRAETEAYARELGIANRVVFTGWRHDLPRVFADLDAVVVSSDNEGTPLSAIEAMAAGRPVVATNVGGLHDLIVDGETGRLVPPRDVQALSTAILDVLRDERHAASMGERARAGARERFGVERLVADIEKLYEHLLSGTTRTVPGFSGPPLPARHLSDP